MNQAPAALTTVAARVTERLDEVLQEEHDIWSGIDSRLSPLLDALRMLVLGGGKRLRPAFCYWGHRAAGGDDNDPAVIDAGAALELLHAFALAHDDVMDGSDLRRGKPTIHEAWAKRHADAGWRGESRRFGDGIAILVGDLAHVLADELAIRAAPQATRLWRDLRTEVNLGQLLDIMATAQRDTELSTARRIARYKSGMYTVEQPLALGANIGGQPELGDRLRRYGDPVGEAFQLRDDMLGAFGDTKLVGKPVGDDLREGKPTMLLSIATERASRTQNAVLETIGTDLTVADVAMVQQVFVDTGAVSQVELHIEQLIGTAVLSLDALRLDPEPDLALRELATFVSARTF